MTLIRLFIVVASLFSASAIADTVFQQGGVAIKGYDTVAYHAVGQAIKGDPQFTSEWRTARWLFSSASNRDLFAANPEKYAPKYGGYCAFAASKGSLAPIDPQAWTIHDEKLYLNYSNQVRGIWRSDIDGNIEKADNNWPALNAP